LQPRSIWSLDPIRIVDQASGIRPMAPLSTCGQWKIQRNSMLHSRGAEGGSYRYVVNVPSDPGIGAVGVYISEARKGVVYCPEFDWNARVYADLSYAQFVEAVRTDAKLVLTGIAFLASELLPHGRSSTAPPTSYPPRPHHRPDDLRRIRNRSNRLSVDDWTIRAPISVTHPSPPCRIATRKGFVRDADVTAGLIRQC
jgi:hypothetical protein